MKGRDLLTEKTRHIRRYRYDYKYRPWADRWTRIDEYPAAPKEAPLDHKDVEDVQAKVWKRALVRYFQIALTWLHKY